MRGNSLPATCMWIAQRAFALQSGPCGQRRIFLGNDQKLPGIPVRSYSRKDICEQLIK